MSNLTGRVISQLPNKLHGHFATPPRICNFIDSLISWVRSFTESYLSDTDNTAPFDNTTPINENKRMQSRLIRLIGVIFLNSAMLSVSDKYDSVNERTQEISKLMYVFKGCGKMPMKFIRQPAHELPDFDSLWFVMM